MALCFCFGRLADRATRCPLQANIVDKHTPELKVLQDDVLGSVHELALGRQIGRGAFGIVIRGRMAFDSGQQARFNETASVTHDVVIKQLMVPTKDLERFRGVMEDFKKEVLLMNRLSHENIVE